MSDNEQRSRTTRIVAPLAVLLVVCGTVALVLGLRAQKHAPQPPASAAIAQVSQIQTASPAVTSPGRPSVTGKAGTAPSIGAVGPTLARSAPVQIDIPDIGVKSNLLQLGINPDHTIQVPPLERDSKAGWYRYSPTPGQVGPSVILGHVDSSEYGPGVFFRLGALRQGNLVDVTRSDHTVGVFRVDRVVSYPKDKFPTLAVYGNTSRAELRLITCGGQFDAQTHNYLNNIVAYASLVSSHPA